MSEINICVVSDFHCHLKGLTDKKSGRPVQDSYLLIDDALPDNLHPINSLYHFIEKAGLKADYLMIPGDLTNKACEVSLSKGWDFIKELEKKIGCRETIITLGNHDVIDTSLVKGRHPLDAAKSLGIGFPYDNADYNNNFYEHGFVFIEDNGCQFLVIDTAFDIDSELRSNHGWISLRQIEKIEQYLANDDSEYNFRIALFHHHPLIHDRCNLGTYDIINNSQNLLNILESSNFSLIIHGHKHDPLIQYSTSGVNPIPVFSAGSIAAFKTKMLHGAMNSCHFLTLYNENIPRCISHGIITTYYFVPHYGWQLMDNFYFPHNAGFGCVAPLHEIIDEIDLWITENEGDELFSWEEICKDLPYLKYLAPNDLSELMRNCEIRNIHLSPQYPKSIENGSRT